MAKTHDFHVRANCTGMTLYHFLKLVLPKNRASAVADLIRAGQVEVNGAPGDSNVKLRMGDYVSVDTDALASASKKPWEQPLEVIYRDKALICVNKPAGVSVIPDRRPGSPTVVDLCREMLAPEGLRPNPVHRLDKWTSGLLVLALQKRFVEPLGKLFEERAVQKTYRAFVRGRPAPPDGVVDVPIGPDSRRMTRIVVDSHMAKPAVTRYKTDRLWQGISLMEVHPETGRTHQIRVHLSHMGHPILCDSLYGGGDAFYLSEIKVNYRLRKGKKERPLLNRQALHAARIAFTSPTGAKIDLNAPLPHDLEVLKKKLDQYGDPLR